MVRSIHLNPLQQFNSTRAGIRVHSWLGADGHYLLSSHPLALLEAQSFGGLSAVFGQVQYVALEGALTGGDVGAFAGSWDGRKTKGEEDVTVKCINAAFSGKKEEDLT